jgi:hypothetical protein
MTYAFGSSGTATSTTSITFLSSTYLAGCCPEVDFPELRKSHKYLILNLSAGKFQDDDSKMSAIVEQIK